MGVGRDVLHTDGARRFFDYWDGLPKEGFVPDRKSFDPIAISDLMRTVTILEIWSPERIEIRLSGTAICEAIGFDPTGRNNFELIAPAAHERYRRLIEAQTSLPCGRWNILRTRHAEGIVTRAEVITLPMFHARSGHHMILSYFGTIEMVGYDTGGYQILAYENTRWVDIGAGVPDWN